MSWTDESIRITVNVRTEADNAGVEARDAAYQRLESEVRQTADNLRDRLNALNLPTDVIDWEVWG